MVWVFLETSTSCVRQCSSFLGADKETKLRCSLDPALLYGGVAFFSCLYGGLPSFPGSTDAFSRIYVVSPQPSLHQSPLELLRGIISLAKKASWKCARLSHGVSAIYFFPQCVNCIFHIVCNVCGTDQVGTSSCAGPSTSYYSYPFFNPLRTCFVRNFILRFCLFPYQGYMCVRNVQSPPFLAPAR